jgi:hypothetical protein
MIGRGDMHRVDVRARQQLTKVVVGLAVGVLVVRVHLALGLVAGALSHIADGHILDIRTAQKRALVATAHVADTDAAHHDPIAGRRDILRTQGGRSDHVRHGNRRASRLQKQSPRSG